MSHCFLFTIISVPKQNEDEANDLLPKTFETAKLTLGEASILGEIFKWLNDRTRDVFRIQDYYVTIDRNILDPPPDKEMDMTSVLHFIIEESEYPDPVLYPKNLLL